MTWGIVPAAGQGSRIQPLAFSKELLPVGARGEGSAERPKAVSEYLIDRLVLGGADKVCFVVSPGKSDIMEYYGARAGGPDIAYVVQPRPVGLCDAVFRARTVVPATHEPVIVGLPDTVWFPEDALARLPDDTLSFLLFPVDQPHLFDAVDCDPDGRVREIQVKSRDARTRWIWGAFKMPGRVFHDLAAFWAARPQPDEYVGTLVNAWLAEGGAAVGVPAGESYIDVGTLPGWRLAMDLLRPALPEVAAA